MKAIIIGVLALLILGGGGAGAYFYFKNPANAAVTSGEEEGGHAKKAEKKSGHGEEGAALNVHFVELDALILPIVGKDGVSQVVSLVVALEVGDEAAAEEVKLMTPRLKDAFIRDLYGSLNREAAMTGGVVQVGAIKKRLTEISKKVLGEEVVQDVLLQVVSQRPI